MADHSINTEFTADVSGLQKGVAQAENSLKKFQKSTVNTGVAMTNLSRVVQDAPFGFIAIQNNLEPLLESFGQLKAQAGSVGGAVKAFAASLAGPAGLVLAFSVASSVVTKLIQKYGSLGEAFRALSTSSNETAKAQRELNQLRKDGAELASKEIARLDLLNAVATDNSNTLSNRKEAANELLKVYKEYLPAIDQEAILNNKAADAINRAKDAILNKALAAAAEKKLADLGKLILENELSKVEAAERYGRALEINRKANEKSIREGVKGIAAVNTATVNANTDLEAQRDTLISLGEAGIKLQKDYDRLLRLGAGFAKIAGDAFIQDPKAKKVREEKPDNFRLFDPVEFFGVDPNKTFEAFKKLYLDTIKRIDPVIAKAGNVTAKINLQVSEQVQQQIDAFNKRKAELNKAFQSISDVLTTPLLNAFAQVTEEGVNAFKALGDAVKSVLKQVIALIAKAALLAGLKALIFPASAGGGSFVSNFLGFLGIGGGVSAPNFGGVTGGLSGNVVFNIRGTDLQGVLTRTNQRTGRVG